MPKEWLQKLNLFELIGKPGEVDLSQLEFGPSRKTIYKEITELFGLQNTDGISNSDILAYFIEKELLYNRKLSPESVRQGLATYGLRAKVGEILEKYPAFSKNVFLNVHAGKNESIMAICNEAIDGIINEFVSVVAPTLNIQKNEEVDKSKESILKKIWVTISDEVDYTNKKDTSIVVESNIAKQIFKDSLCKIIDNSGCSREIINDIYMHVDKFLFDNPNALTKILSEFSNGLNPIQEGVLDKISAKLKSSFLDEIIGKNKFSNVVTNVLFNGNVSDKHKLVGKKLARHIEIILKDSIEEKDKFPQVRDHLIEQLETNDEVKAKIKAIIEKYPQITEENFFQKEGARETIKRIAIAIASVLLVGLPFAFKSVREAVAGPRVEDVSKEIKQVVHEVKNREVDAGKGGKAI